MTKETSVRVRMVRCPKCSKVLVELPEFTLYKCGGCGTSLQAKNWKPESAAESQHISGTEASNSPHSENERIEDEDEKSPVEELCLDKSGPSSHSGSPEAKPASNQVPIQERNSTPLRESENSDIKIDEEGEVVAGNCPNEEGEVDVDNVNGGGGDSSRSSPVIESHVSLYMTSPDDDAADHSPAVRRSSSTDGYGFNVGDFTNRKSESYHAYYGSESSYDANEDLNFQRTPRSNRRSKHIEEMRLKEDRSTDSELLHTLRDGQSFVRSSLPPRPISRPLQYPPSPLEPSKMDLLRTVEELKDQLRKMQISSRIFHPRDLQEKFDVSHSSYAHHHPRQEPCGSHSRSSCLRCCCPHSSQIPSHYHHCKNSCEVSSSSSSPHHHCVGPSQSSKEKMIRLPSMEKPPRKRLLPLAGGAPFVGCYYCFELLQLPADFVVFDGGRRCNRLLRCSSCKKVLRFSILDRTKIIHRLRNDSAAAAPPSSEAGESSNGRKMKSVEERSKLSNSPLHRLMGYSSPGRVLNNR